MQRNSSQRYYPDNLPLSPKMLARLIGAAVGLFVLIIILAQVTYVVMPGDRGVRITLGRVSPEFLPQGLGFKAPFVSSIVKVMVRQRTQPLKVECYSSDLQQVNTELVVLFRIPEESVVKIFQQYAGDPFDSLIAPRVQEALKEVAALQTAEMIVTNRLDIKSKALSLARIKIGTNFLNLVDLVIQDITLSQELATAIEEKMIREQEASKAKFFQKQAEIEAKTAVIKARGTAESIRIRGEALDLNPAFIDLQIIEMWDGKSPLVIGLDNGANVMIPLGDVQKLRP